MTQWFGDQLRTLDRMADGVTDAVSQAAKDPPWSVWQWKPHTLPVPGDKAWLEVGEFLRRQGVF